MSVTHHRIAIEKRNILHLEVDTTAAPSVGRSCQLRVSSGVPELGRGQSRALFKGVISLYVPASGQTVDIYVSSLLRIIFIAQMVQHSRLLVDFQFCYLTLWDKEKLFQLLKSLLLWRPLCKTQCVIYFRSCHVWCWYSSSVVPL